MLITVCLSGLLSLFSTSVMAYIAMATPIGPWIAPTLVLACMALLRLLRKYTNVSEQVVLVVSSGSIGGILATASGFAFPTLYFLSPNLFNQWLENPLLFTSILGSLSFLGGWFGLFLANVFDHSLIVEQKLPFPVGNMVYKMVLVQTKAKKVYNLFIGFWSSFVFCMLQTGARFIPSVIPKAITFLPAFSISIIQIPTLTLSLMPMLWAIGFVTGLAIVFSLAAGGVAKIVIVEPIRQLYFSNLQTAEFTLAFCSGMVVAGVLNSFLKLFKSIKSLNFNHHSLFGSYTLSREKIIEMCVLSFVLIIVLKMYDFTLTSLLYLLLFSSVCAYQIALIAGKIGLAQLGRFATFVMVPGMFLFNFNYVQAVVVATFVELCGGVMTDVLFGRKLAMLSGVSLERVKKYQYFGLLVSSLAVGFIFWLLISKFQLGGSELFAQRAQARALLIQAQQFNFEVLLVGLLFGGLLKLTPLSPMLVLGGLLMPLNLTLGFVGGALLTLLYEKPQEWIPFYSGVFAANSIWMVLQALACFFF